VLDRNNTSVIAQGVAMPVVQTPIFVSPKQRKMALNLTSPSHALPWNALNQVASNGDVIQFDVYYNGLAFSKEVKAVNIDSVVQNHW
jgi:hypothetical protein